MIGYEISADDVVKQAMQDKAFFDNSNGGVTLTGGEPTAQPEFLLEILGLLKNNDVHTALETCGHFPRKLIDPLVEHVDLFLFDLKHISKKKHKTATGVDNTRIVENYRDILNKVGNERIIPRIPVIPGFNNDKESITSLIEFLNGESQNGSVELMSYNNLARNKYKKIGLNDSAYSGDTLSDQQKDNISSIFSDHGLKTIWN